MDKIELTDRLLILCGDHSSFTVWDAGGDYFGEFRPITLCGFRVSWGNNDVSCPSESEIESVPTEDVESYRQSKADQILVDRYKNNLAIKLLYKQAKANDPDLTFINFIKDKQDEIGDI